MLRPVFVLLSSILLVRSEYGLPPSYNIFFQNHGFNDYGKRDIYNSGGLFSSSVAPYGPPPPPSDDFNFVTPQYNPYGWNSFPQPQPQPQPQPNNPGCGMAPASCPKTQYRSYDGSCNNLRNPVLGTPNTPYNRLLPPRYADGISQPPVSVSGKPLPNARLVSLTLYPDIPIQDPIWTLAAMQYGQIMTHDMSLLAGGSQTKPHSISCCSSNGQLVQAASNAHWSCFPLVVPEGDPIYSKTNVRCMNFVRTLTDRDRNCVGGYRPAEQLTSVNHFLDLSLVYGNNDQLNRQLREMRGGRMRVEMRGGADWPPSSPNKTRDCVIQSEDEPCYLAGDSRVNQNPQLTVIQILLLREHNRIADALAQLNPHWDDETIFQEARKIAIAEHQHISYYEWLPIFIGARNAMKNKIIYNTKDFIPDYNEDVDPTILNEHSTAAFRFFHSLISGKLHLVQEHRYSYNSIRLSDWFNRPLILEQNDNFDDLTRGLGSQNELAPDRYHDSEITQYLFRNNQTVGSDLKSIDIQRNRDHGLASYNDYRHFCGLPKAHSFHDFLDMISPELVNKLAQLYDSPDDVDLPVGGSLEKLVPGTLAGPTLLCILTEQFYRTRVGDRFFFENGNQFTLEQLNELRKASISRIFCDNAHYVQSMQPRGFEVISENNAVVPCDHLPAVDLSFWKEHSPQPNVHYYY